MAPSVVASTSLHSSIDVVARELFYSRNDHRVSVPNGSTLEDILAALAWPESSRPWTVIYINSQEIFAELWHKVRPRPGTEVFIAIRPQGGKKGKGTLMAIAAIAISIAAIVVAPYLVGAYLGIPGGVAAASFPLSTAIVAGGLAVAGNLALGALIKPASANLLTGTSSADLGGGVGGSANALGSNSPASAGALQKSFALSGGANSAQTYSPVMQVLGRHRVVANLAAETYIVSEGGVQIAYMLFDFGEGPLQVEDIRIGVTPYQNFTGIQLVVHSAFRAGDRLQLYSGDHATDRVDSTIEQNVNIVRAAPQNANRIAVEIQAPGGMIRVLPDGTQEYTASFIEIYFKHPNQPLNNITAFNPQVLYRGDEGVGSNGWNQVGDMGVVSMDKSRNSTRMAQTSGPAPLVGESILMIDMIYYRITALRQEPDQIDPWPGQVQFEIFFDGLPSSADCQRMQDGRSRLSRWNTVPTAAIAGLWNVYDTGGGQFKFEGKTTSAQSATITWTAPYAGEWEVLIVGRTQSFSGTTIVNQLKWTTVRGIRDQAPVRPSSPRTLMEVRIAASENINGQIDAFSALCTSVIRLWEGSSMPTRNPALLALGVMTGDAASKKIPWDQIDVTKFNQWNLWCQVPVRDSDGQMRQRCTCDMIVDTRTTVGDLLTIIASCGRAAITIIDGKYSVLMEDEPRTAVQLFTERNSRNMSISRTWVDQPHAMRMGFVDENTWEKSEVVAYNTGYNVNNATKFETIDMTGCVRGGQAWRDGMYLLAAGALRREKLNLNTDIENIVCARGDIILVSNDLFYGAVSARVMGEVAPGVMQLDIRSDVTNLLVAQIRYSDGTIQSGTIGGWVNEDEIFLSDWLPNNLQNGAPANTATPGTPGVAPANWALAMNTPANGVSREIVGVGVESGMPYVDVRLFGTATANMSIFFRSGATNVVSYPLGAERTTIFYMRWLTGSISADLVMGEIISRDSANTIVGPVLSYDFALTRGSILDPVVMARTISDQPTAAFIESRIRLRILNGRATDFTVRVANDIISSDYVGGVLSEGAISFSNDEAYDVDWVSDEDFGSMSLQRKPEPGDLITLGTTQANITEWIVESVTPGPDLSASIVGIERRPEILDADTGIIPPYVPPGGTGILAPINPPTAVGLSYYETFINGIPHYQCRLDWAAPVGTIVSSYEITLDGVNLMGTVKAAPFDFVINRNGINPSPQIATFTVTVVSARGARGVSAPVVGTFYRDSTPPVLEWFTSNVVGDQLILFWGTQDTPDMHWFQIRFWDVQGVRDWNEMTIAVDRVSGDATSVVIARRTGVYAIRAVDTGGNWSTPLYTSVIIESPETLDLYDRLVEPSPNWVGSFVGITVEPPNELRLRNNFTEGWFYPDASVFEPFAWRFLLRGEIDAYSPNSATPDDWNAEIWVSSLGSSPVLSSSWFDPLSTAVPLAGLAGAYAPLGSLQSTLVDATIVQWAVRLTRKNLATQVRVRSAALVVDHQERSEFGSDIAIPSVGVRVYFAHPFFDPPSITLTIEGTTVVGHYTKTSTEDSFFVQVFNPAGVAIAAQLDWQALGFGRRFV